MKKKKVQQNVHLYKLPGAAVAGSNQLRLKQIYDSAYNSREKSPVKNNPYATKNPLATRYQLPLTDRKSEHRRKPNENNRYQSYLENQIVSQVRPNRRYQPIPRGSMDRDRSSLANNRQSSNAPTKDRSYDIENPIRKRSQNQSADMFQIRKSRQKISSRRISAANLTKSVNRTTHISNPMPPPSNVNRVLEDQFQEGKKLYKQGKHAEALAIFEELLLKDSKNPEFLYQAAMAYLSKKNYQSGLQLLDRICRYNSTYKKTVYFFAAICCKNLNRLQEAIDYCSNGLEAFPNYQDLLAYRAKVHELKGEYQLAHRDYDQILARDKNNVQILIKNAEALRKAGAYANSLSNLATALYADSRGQHRQEILIRKIQIHLQTESLSLKQAKKDLNKLIASDQKSSDISYLKGRILLHEGFKKEAVLCFQQSIKEASSKQAMAKSLIEITKGKIQQRDFYSAYYHICRSQYLDLHSSEIEIYKLFAEGVVYLMKRKIAEGNENFNKLVAKYPQICSDLKTIFHLYRAFAHFCLSDFTQSIVDYELANSFEPLDIYARFNKLLAQGIVKVSDKNYAEGIQYFNEAQKLIGFTKLNKIQPSLYRSATHIQKAKDLLQGRDKKDMEELKSLEEIFSALKELDRAYDINDGNSNMLYYRSLIYLHLGKFDQALQDIIKAISKSQENVAKYFFFRALAHASLGNLKQALNDFNICNNLDEKFHLVYLERAKIHFANENVTKGLEDLVKLKAQCPNEDIKYHQACLNYVYGHYIMANACCEEIVDQEKARDIKILIKTKIGRLKEAKKLVTAKADIMIYEILQGNIEGLQEQSSSHLEYFTFYHYQHYLGVKQFMKGDFQKAIDMFIMATKQRTLYDLEQGISNNDLNQNNETENNEDQEEENFDGDSEKDTIHKINFNIFVAYLMMGDWKKGYEVFIRDIVGAKSWLLKNEYMATFSHLLFQAVKGVEDLGTQEKEVYELNLYQSKLSRSQKELAIELPNIIIKTRLVMLGMCNPKLERKYKTRVDPDFILSYMKMSQIQNRPEPPWVKREQSGLIFTDDIQHINIEFQTTENDESQGEDQEDQEGENEEYEDESGQGEEQEQQESKQGQLSVNKFKQKMKLDDSIERKLQKIMEKKKQISASSGKNNY